MRNGLSALLILLLISLPSLAKEDQDQFYVKIPEFEKAPKIDGVLDNPLWLKTAVFENFTQFQPKEGAPASEKTIAYMAYDKTNLYIAIRCFDSDAKAIRANLCQRDKVPGDDQISIFLDTFNDRKRAFVFKANPCGVQSDGIVVEGGGGDGHGPGFGGFIGIDSSWDAYFISAATVDEEGYTVELAIPFKSLRFANAQTQVWGLQIQRTIPRKNEQDFWFPRSRNVNGFLVQTGKIEITDGIERGKNLEIMPVVTGLKENGKKLASEPGLNLKYGITSDITVDATVNPDYSQVEADIPQNEVNQRYPLRYPEKRPFFLEGRDIFNTPIELAYTRKIVEPEGGFKLTGKMGKTSFGFLSTVDNYSAKINIPATKSDKTTNTYLHKAFVNILRLRTDLFKESSLGFTMTDKELGSSWGNMSGSNNRVFGMDGNFKFLNNYRLSFQVLGSSSKARMITPDKEETAKTDIVPAITFNLNRVSRHLNFSLNWMSIHPDFEASSGFIRRKDIQSLSFGSGYTILPQKKVLTSVTPSFNYQRIYDFDQTLTDEQFQFNLGFDGWKNSNLNFGFSTAMERFEDINFNTNQFRIFLHTQASSWISGGGNFSFGNSIYYGGPYLGYKTSYGLEINLKPLSNLRFTYSIDNEEFYKEKGGEKVYQVNILSQQTNYQISRFISLRLITNYNDYDKKLYNSLLFSYEFRPGTVFYLGMEDNQEKNAGIFQKTGRYYFVKFSYWWRV